MPIKSRAQRRKFAELLVRGEISPKTFERWNREAGSAELPERLHPGRGPKGKGRKPAAKRRKPARARRAKAARPRKTGSRAGKRR